MTEAAWYNKPKFMFKKNPERRSQKSYEENKCNQKIVNRFRTNSHDAGYADSERKFA